jgi:hypothetical protein
MKKIFSILIALAMCFTLSSCVVSAQAQIDDMYDEVDIRLIVSYGTPYYTTDGLLMYYIYRNMYYYPYYYNNRYYLHRYSKPLPPNRMRMYRPVPRDFYKHAPLHRNHTTPRNRSTYHMRPNTHSTQSRPKGNVSHSNRSGGSHGHFGRSHR